MEYDYIICTFLYMLILWLNALPIALLILYVREKQIVLETLFFYGCKIIMLLLIVKSGN